ncbi:alcohol dehydrogenase [Brevibacterium litoralis]|uniref:alcohol dehydrogenase n=1 Tax=Brevibacterium litoralis TaxID=3138935 RepID=UPI0032EBB9D1
MRAFVTTGPSAPLELREVDDPTPTGSQVFLAVRHSGVCHSDTHVHAGSYDAGSKGELSMAQRGLEYPAVHGHEMVGEVVAVGPDVRTVKPGDLRLVYPWLGCGECLRCTAGNTNLCRKGRALGIIQWGGFADHVLVPDEEFLIDIDGLDPAWAATLACSGLTSFSAVHQVLPVEADEAVAVIGTGGVGLMAVALLSQLTDAEVIAVDVDDSRLQIARELGADRVVNSTALEEGATLDVLAGRPVAAVIDFVNTGATFDLGFSSLDKGGHLVSIGLFGGEAAVPTVMLPLKVITVTGSYVGTLQQLRDLVEFARSHELPKVPIIERPLNLQEAQRGLDDLNAGTVQGRIVLAG